MKSRTSFFNKGISLNLLRRCWPLWASYLGLLILVTPVALSSRYVAPGENLDYELLSMAKTCMFIGFPMAALTAMCMFSYLYNNRACGMMCSLPVKRETMFITVTLTGIVPIIVCNGIVTLLVALLFRPKVLIALRYAAGWFAIVSLADIAFYGFAVFCAMLTGGIIILPAVYVVLTFTVPVIEVTARAILSEFVYGFISGDNIFDFLSPVVGMAQYFKVSSDYTDQQGVYHLANIEGGWVLAAYAVVGVLFAVAALFLYRKRRMETAGDAVSIPILKPVFKYCLSVGCALVLTALVTEEFFHGVLHGTAMAVLIAFLLCVGAFIGWFAAEMLIQKSVRVFRKGWKGLILIASVLVVLVGLWEADAFGYERKVPDVQEIEGVYLSAQGSNMTGELYDPANFTAVTELHRLIVREKGWNEHAARQASVSINYVLKNGRHLSRLFEVSMDVWQLNDAQSSYCQCENVLNLQEAVESRSIIQNLDFGSKYTSLGISWDLAVEGKYDGGYAELTSEEIKEFYETCYLPDVKEGRLGKVCHYSDRYLDGYTNLTVNISSRSEAPTLRQYDFFGSGYYESVWVEVPLTAERTIAWITEHTGAPILTQRELHEKIENYVEGVEYAVPTVQG